MSKNDNLNVVNQEEAEKENLSALSDETKKEVATEEIVYADNKKKVEAKQQNKKDNKNAKNKKNSKKESGKLKRKTKETFSELKKVTWPSFGEVCKKTGVVLVVVLVFAVVLFGIDYGLGALMSLLKK